MTLENPEDYLRSNIQKLLNTVGRESECKGCGKKIWWVMTKNNRAAPYTETALNHFADCPKAAEFRAKK